MATTNGTPKSPVPSAITGEIGKFDHDKLKHAETQEKNPLPSKEALAQEKAESNLRNSIEGFDGNLKHVNTQEKKGDLPDKSVINQEKTMQNIEAFNKEQLKHAETQEKNPLPDKAVVQAEKEHQTHMSGIEDFSKDGLKHVAKVQEKTVMPDSGVINQEKTIQNIEAFDKNSLKHAETQEKNPLPDKKTIEEEKRLSSSS